MKLRDTVTLRAGVKHHALYTFPGEVSYNVPTQQKTGIRIKSIFTYMLRIQYVDFVC